VASRAGDDTPRSIMKEWPDVVQNPEQLDKDAVGASERLHHKDRR